MSSFVSQIFSGSARTSNVCFVGDAEELTVFLDIDSDTTATIQGSNAQGFREAIAEDDWSTLTTMANITANDLVNVEPGFRWIRGIRESASAGSWSRMIVAGRNATRRS